MYFCDYSFAYDPSRESFKQYRLRSVLRYLGLKDTKADMSFIAPFLSLVEALLSTIIVTIRMIVVFCRSLNVNRETYYNQNFFACLTFAGFRLKGLLESIRPEKVRTLKIPFIKNEYSENEVDILSCISIRDIIQSLISSWYTIWLMYFKYRKRDPLFRSYSSFEYYLTCCFVDKTQGDNSFVYFNTFDRWAFLMCNTTRSIFIQHGKLMDTLKLIKVGVPHIAYYLNQRQQLVLEKVLFKGTPSDVKFKKTISFTSNELLVHNEKKNVLLVCWVNNLDKEWEICSLIGNLVNLYIKPHPGDKDNPEYPKMANQFNCKIIPKTGFPQVDVVISYDSTLADEYEDVGVKVIRYDLLDSLDEIIKLI